MILYACEQDEDQAEGGTRTMLATASKRQQNDTYPAERMSGRKVKMNFGAAIVAER